MEWHIKSSIFLLHVCLISLLLYVGQDLLVPLTFGIFFAFLLLPVASWLEKHTQVPRLVATIISVGILLSFAVGVVIVMSTQLVGLVHEIANIQQVLTKQFGPSARSVQQYAHQYIDLAALAPLLDYLKTGMLSFVKSTITSLVRAFFLTTKTVTTAIVVITYIFLLLLYRGRFEQLMYALTTQTHRDVVWQVQQEILRIMPHYFLGALIIITIETVVNSIGLYFIGVHQPIFWGAFVAFFYIIPFFGILIGSSIAVLFILLTQGLLIATLVASLFLCIQLIENYILVPLVMGNQMQLNPLAIILVVVLGGTIWGIAGMILFMPLLAMLNIVMSHMPSLKPYAHVLESSN